ncbi:MAG TPA: hypothetical protein VK473_15630 [Terriglobales bacterium]|nr:hypothetical protein [Terriglobales bacterium]
MALIRTLSAEQVFVRKPFPQGRKGLTIKDGTVSPSDAELQVITAAYGPAAKPGDRALITLVKFKPKSIIFEINGGPERKKKWYEHIEVSGPMGSASPGTPNENTNPRGSYVELMFDNYVPELTPNQVKDLLSPVLDFHSKSAVEAYLDTIPPKAKEAIKNHQVLVGMNREMVVYAKGRPPQKTREKDGDAEYEEWIYGVPPEDVEFVRFVGDEVVRLEVMKVDGKKMVRTEKEVDLQPATVAKKQEQEPQTRPANAPSLRRPGEEADDDLKSVPVGTPRPAVPEDSPTSDPAGSPGHKPAPPHVPN